MARADLESVRSIAEVVHADSPESDAVFTERLRLFPEGCWIADGGYAIAHPWQAARPPALNTILRRLPPAADCLHLHDVALLPDRRGLGLGAALLKRLDHIAAGAFLPRLTLIAVHDSEPYWRRHGFTAFHSDHALQRLRSYGASAHYLSRPVGGRG
jgi:GNAT superfamily N-acetyltransferase